MKTILFLTFSILILLCSCNQSGPNEKAEVSIDQEEAIKNKLETIAKDFLKSWEPPFNPEGAVALFTQSEDFHLVIDGINIDTYSKWANGVPNFMADDDLFFKSYKHEIKEIKTAVLSPESGVVTITYIWDNISKDDVQKERMVRPRLPADKKRWVGRLCITMDLMVIRRLSKNKLITRLYMSLQQLI